MKSPGYQVRVVDNQTEKGWVFKKRNKIKRGDQNLKLRFTTEVTSRDTHALSAYHTLVTFIKQDVFHLRENFPEKIALVVSRPNKLQNESLQSTSLDSSETLVINSNKSQKACYRNKNIAFQVMVIASTFMFQTFQPAICMNLSDRETEFPQKKNLQFFWRSMQ